jgi:RNA polymerase sigma factor (sigma-70 family)
VERSSSAGWVWLALRRGSAVRSQTARMDGAAFAAVYERHHQALYRYCRAILHDDEEARDALQSTMAKALAALRSEERDFELRPWLFRIAHNEAVSRVRQRREVAGLDSVSAVGTDSLAQAVEDRERVALLRADLRELPERQRAALVLRELNGLGHEEIAAVLDSSPRAVKQTIFEARAALHDCAAGRAMPCAEIKRALSDGDGRVLRGRRIRAHVRSCPSCQRFKSDVAQRRADLAVLAPGLPGAAGALLLGHVLPAAQAGATSSAMRAAGLGSGAAGTMATKAALLVAATATLAGGGTVAREVRRPSPRASLASSAHAHVVPVRPVLLRPHAVLSAAPPSRERTQSHRPMHRSAHAHGASAIRPPTHRTPAAAAATVGGTSASAGLRASTAGPPVAATQASQPLRPTHPFHPAHPTHPFRPAHPEHPSHAALGSRHLATPKQPDAAHAPGAAKEAAQGPTPAPNSNGNGNANGKAVGHDGAVDPLPHAGLGRHVPVAKN